MASDEKSCSMCKSYQKQLIEKEVAIKLLTIRLQKIKDYVLNIDTDDQCNPCHDQSNFNETDLFRGSSTVNYASTVTSKCTPSESCSSEVQNTAHFHSDNITEEDKTKTATSSKFSSDSDYVYDQNYRMYYSQSTGYYYDEKSGLMYDPRTRIYYKYDYDTKTYDQVPCESSLNDQNASSTAVNKVDNAETSVSASDVAVEKSETVENSSEELAASKDWLVDEGSNVTIADKVREAINANCKDYLYDESSKMYVIPSTGQYFDTERNLLYDPSTAAYYSYNNEEGKYEYYCPANLNQSATKEYFENENISKEERLKQRKQFWKRKLKKDVQVARIKVEKSVDECPDKECSDEDSSEEKFSSPEDGEIFSSDDEFTQAFISKPPIRSPSSPPQPSCKSDVPPAVRAIVISSESMQIGSLILISTDSDFIGREKSNSVILPDTSVSKVHAEVKFCKEIWKYSIQDLGSQNGTYINGHRLSESKEKSGFYWLNHGSLLALGSCKLLIHIHPELETCDDCEPGQVIAALALLNDELTEAKHIVLTKEEKEKQRREELRKIKKKYNLQGADFQRQLNSVPSKGYEDKASIRRQTVGSDNPYEKTEQASIDKHIPETNKGYQMLKKMGWKLGEKLGAKGDRPEKVPE